MTLAAIGQANARNHTVLVNIKARAPVVNDIHLPLPQSARRRGDLAGGILQDMLRDRCRSVAKLRVIEAPRVQLTNGLLRTKKEPTSVPTL